MDLRRVAVSPVPALRGLRARWWRAERRALVGRYLFEDDAALAEFRGTPERADPALAELTSHGSTTQVRTSCAQDIDEQFQRPVFIVCAPRTGSTLLYDLLRSCPGLWSLGREMQDLIDGIPALNIAHRSFASHALEEGDATAEVTATLKHCLLLDASGCGDGHGAGDSRPPLRFLDKTCENALRLRFLERAFPGARYVFLYRDLRQNVSSLVEAWQHPGFIAIPDLPGFARRHWCFLLPREWQRMAEVTLSELAAFQWHAANRSLLNELEAIPPKRWMAISYEELVAAPAQTIARVCGFMEVEPAESLSHGRLDSLQLSPTTISPPSPIKWRSNRHFTPHVVKGLQPLAGDLRNLRVHATPPVLRAAQDTSVRLALFADELPTNAVPAAVVVAPSLRVQLGSTVPAELFSRIRHRERFLPDHPVLWTQDPATQMWCPLWLRQRQAWLCSALHAGEAPPTALTGALYAQLHCAGVLVSLQTLEERRAYGESLTAKARGALEHERFCVLPDLLPPLLRTLLARYYNALIESGEWPLGDAQVRRRHGWHNERVASFVQLQLVEILSSFAGRALKPTYCFASAYRGGADLDVHTDREQCDFTLSLTIDERRPAGAPAWPLWFMGPHGPRSVELAPGDGVFFRGCELPHWRGTAMPEHSQTNLLFHYVPSEWAGVVD